MKMNKFMMISVCFMLAVSTLPAADSATNANQDKAKMDAEAKRKAEEEARKAKMAWEAKEKAEAAAKHRAEQEARRKAAQEQRRVQDTEWKTNNLVTQKKYAEAREAYLKLASDTWLLEQGNESAMARYRVLAAKVEALASKDANQRYSLLHDAFYAGKDKMNAKHLADAANVIYGVWRQTKPYVKKDEELNQIFQIAFEKCKAEKFCPSGWFFINWCDNLYYNLQLEHAEEVTDWAYDQMISTKKLEWAFFDRCYIQLLKYAHRDSEIVTRLQKALEIAVEQKNQSLQGSLQERIADHLPKTERITFYRKKGDLIRAAEIEGGIDAKRNVAAQMLKNPTLSLKERIPAMKVFMHDVGVDPGIYWFRFQPQALQLNREMRAKYLKEFAEAKDVKVEQLIHSGEVNSCMWYGMYGSVVSLLEPFHKAGKWIVDKDILSLGVSYCAVGRIDDAVQLYESVANSKRSAETRFRAAMAARILKCKTKGQMLDAYKDVRKQFAEEKAISERTAMDALRYVGNIFVICGLNEQAHAVLDADESMIVKLPVRTYTVKYSENPLHSVAEILAVKPEVQLLDRKIGSNKYDFMTTDVSTGRVVAEQDKDKKNRPTEFMAVCDELGFHLLFHCFDERGIGLETGNIGTGGFEMYLAPGPNQPYTCFLTNNGKGTVDLWNTTYNNEHYRRLPQDDPREFFMKREFTRDGYYMHFFFAWRNYYDTLPVDKDDFYEFENVFWGPSAPQTWAGLALIHSRSTWGRLFFDITPNQAVKIRRNILMAALPYYNRESWANRAHHGVYHLWSDTELGDLEFYNSILLPLRQQLDAARNRIKPDMSDDEVNELYRDTIHNIREIRVKAEQLRADYLMEKLSEE